jgi:hypothetical protein
MLIESATYRRTEAFRTEVEIVIKKPSGELESHLFGYHANPMGFSKLFYDKRIVAKFRNYRDVGRILDKAIEHLEGILHESK